MENQMTERERARNAALAMAVDHARGKARAAAQLVEDAEIFFKFLTKRE